MVEEFWSAFGEANRPDVECDDTGSLAVAVCGAFDVPYTGSVGGSLPNVDIKHMDALTVIKLSLLEEAAENGILYEPMVDGYGRVEFKDIGGSGGYISDKYYTIQSYDYREKCSGVMVTGGKPMPERKKVGWSSILDSAQIFSTNQMMTNCLKFDFDQYATIVYNDPHLDTAYNDGIKNLYEIGLENVYEKVIGYAWKITPPDIANDDTSISFNNATEIPLRIAEGPNPNIGELISLPITSEGLECWVGRGVEAPAGAGIKIEIPSKFRYETVRDTTIDKFLGVSQVYVIGKKLDKCIGIPISDSAASEEEEPSEINTQLYISCNNNVNSVYKLDKGVHYVVSYIGAGAEKEVRIVFAKNSRPYDAAKFGTGVKYEVIPFCLLSDAGKTSGVGTVLPTGGVEGILVEEVWAVLSLETPSINIVDPGQNALAIAEQLKIECCPLVVTEEPAPIAKDGTLIDLTDGIVDHDPTTTQDLQNTALENAISEMTEGPGLSLSFSFLDDEQVRRLSGSLYSYMGGGGRSGVGAVHTCGPDCDVELGDNGISGGVINSISYSYTDGGSYTISVTEGPKVLGSIGGITGSFYTKQTEEISAQGTIIQDAGNHIDYKVRIDGFGDRYAINCCSHVLRVGDRVQVSVHNNPVED